MKPAGLLVVLLMLHLLSACAGVRYYAQSVSGQLNIMTLQEPIDSLLSDDAVDDELKVRLNRLKAIRRFASEELALFFVPRAGKDLDTVCRQIGRETARRWGVTVRHFVPMNVSEFPLTRTGKVQRSSLQALPVFA